VELARVERKLSTSRPTLLRKSQRTLTTLIELAGESPDYLYSVEKHNPQGSEWSSIPEAGLNTKRELILNPSFVSNDSHDYARN
jgi:hypothetical protein